MELWEMVEANMTESAEKQKRNYPGQNLAIPTVGESVLLDDPARGNSIIIRAFNNSSTPSHCVVVHI